MAAPKNQIIPGTLAQFLCCHLKNFGKLSTRSRFFAQPCFSCVNVCVCVFVHVCTCKTNESLRERMLHIMPDTGDENLKYALPCCTMIIRIS